MAEGSAHLCRCTIATMAILFIISLGLFIGAWNIEAINSVFGLRESGGLAPVPPSTHNFTSMFVKAGDGADLSVRLVNWNPPNSSIIVNSTIVTYVVLLHGVPEAGELAWRDIIATMPTTWIYIIPDMRGSGNSSKTPYPEAYAMFNLISDLSYILNATVKANTSVNLVGHDFGGVLAFAYSHVYPSQVRTLTTLEAAHPIVIQQQLQQFDSARSSFQDTYKYMIPTADAAFANGFSNFPILDLGKDWWTSRRNEYIGMWSSQGGTAWASILNYWRINLLLTPSWAENGVFNAQTRFDWSFNVTAQQISATIKMVFAYPTNSQYFLPGAASLAAPYLKKYSPPVYVNGSHWINHGQWVNITSLEIKQNILNA